MLKINVKDVMTETIHDVYAYLLDDFKECLIDENAHFFENYSSKNDLFDEYKIDDDSPENYVDLVKQLKN